MVDEIEMDQIIESQFQLPVPEEPEDQFSHHAIICPWCECEHYDEGFEDQSQTEWTCDRCEKVFYATIETCRDYTTSTTK